MSLIRNVVIEIPRLAMVSIREKHKSKERTKPRGEPGLRWPTRWSGRPGRRKRKRQTEMNLTERPRCVQAGEEARPRKGLRKPCRLHVSRPSTSFVDRFSAHLPRSRSGRNRFAGVQRLRKLRSCGVPCERRREDAEKSKSEKKGEKKKLCDGPSSKTGALSWPLCLFPLIVIPRIARTCNRRLTSSNDFAEAAESSSSLVREAEVEVDARW